jgi:flagellin-like hook-associated protein FlgL
MSPKSPKLSRIMTFVGAGIVLATFVVKDIMREKLKDINDSLGSAEAFYLTQTYNIFIQDDIVYIKQEVDLALSALQINGKNQLEGSEQMLRTKAQAGNDHLNVVIEYVRTLAGLIEKLPQETSKSDEANRLLAQCTQLSTEMKSLQNRLPTLLSAINQNPKDPQAFAELAEFVKETEPIPVKTQSIMDEAKKLTQSVVSDLARKKKESERNYERTNILSYILFAMGWITGLAGQLLGVGGQAES